MQTTTNNNNNNTNETNSNHSEMQFLVDNYTFTGSVRKDYDKNYNIVYVIECDSNDVTDKSLNEYYIECMLLDYNRQPRLVAEDKLYTTNDNDNDNKESELQLSNLIRQNCTFNKFYCTISENDIYKHKLHREHHIIIGLHIYRTLDVKWPSYHTYY